VKICSFHPSREAAEDFAEELRKKGAEGVEVGKETSAGYPVFSVAPTGIEPEDIERKQRAHMPEPTEEYAFETTTTPVGEEMGLIEIEGRKFQKSKPDIIRIAKEELQRAHLGDVRVRVSTYQGIDPEAPYADATWFKRGGNYYINIHPIHQYYDEAYTREVVQHEIEHILGEMK